MSVTKIFFFLINLILSSSVMSMEDIDYTKGKALYAEKVSYNYEESKIRVELQNKEIILATTSLKNTHVIFTKKLRLAPEDIQIFKSQVYSLKTQINKYSKNKYIITVILFNESKKEVLIKVTSKILRHQNIQGQLGKMLKIVLEKLATI